MPRSAGRRGSRSSDCTSTPAELRKLLEDDLATLLAEQFDLSRRPLPAPERPRVTDADTRAAPLTSLIGRDEELHAVQAMLRRQAARRECAWRCATPAMRPSWRSSPRR